jgi:hypothetical protein
VAWGVESGEGMVGAMHHAERYWRAFTDLPPPKELSELLERVFSGRGLYLYVR